VVQQIPIKGQSNRNYCCCADYNITRGLTQFTLMLFVLKQSLHKCKHQVDEKIPDGYQTNSKEFRKIEIKLSFAYQKPNYGGIHAQPYYRKKQKPGIFNSEFRIITMKSPPAVQKIITAGCNRKTNSISNIFLNFKFFFTNPGCRKVDYNPGGPNSPELHKFNEYILRKVLQHGLRN
jgi:hypothetical protein